LNKRAFYQNTAVMTATSLLLRILGILFRIFISNRVGAEGMGLYQLVFSVYILGATFATGGLTTAVTCLAAEKLTQNDTKGVRKMMGIAVVLCLASLADGGPHLSSLLLYAGGAVFLLGFLLRLSEARQTAE
jgi:stage V sporulation protein B